MRPCAPLDDWSTPELAHTNPCRVSVIRTGPIWRTMRFDSPSTTSTTRGSLSHSVAHSIANFDGFDVVEFDRAAFSLGDDLGRDQHHVAVVQVDRLDDQFGEIVARLDLREDRARA